MAISVIKSERRVMDWGTLDKLIDELENMIDVKVGKGLSGVVGVIVPASLTWTWGDIWAKAAEVQNGFKGVCYPTKIQREEAWSRFNSLRDEASERSKDERDSRRLRSETLKSEILSKVESARPEQQFLSFHIVNIEELKALSQVLRESGEMLSERKREMLGEHKQECFEAIQRMREVHDIWWDKFKEEKTKRHDDFQARVKRNIETNYERHRKATDALEHCRAKADELRSQIASAWNDDWAARAEGWLSELEDKIADIERSVEQIEVWIKEDESKLQ